MERMKDIRLMLITQPSARFTEVQETQMAIQGGCDWIQLRMKNGINSDTLRACVALCQAETERHITLCVDDDLQAAIRYGARACHLGKKDMPVDEAFRIVHEKLSPDADFLIGATANTFEDIQIAAQRGASYIGLGPYRFTQTKTNLSPILGLEGYRRIVARCMEAGINLPIFAIGGILLEDVGQLMETGIQGIAISGAIINAPDPVAATQCFIEEINKHHI